MKKKKPSITFPLFLMPFRQAIDKAHLLCQNLRLTYLQQLDKSIAECVTLADYGVQVIINRILCDIYPESGIIAEENSNDFFRITTNEQQEMIIRLTNLVLGENLSMEEFTHWLDYGQDQKYINKTWVIDPIDGTQEYIKSNRYVIGVGLLDNAIPIFSFLSSFSPEKGKPTYYFTWNDFAYKYDSFDESITVLKVSDRLISSARAVSNDGESKVHNIGYIEDDVYSTLGAYISIAAGESDVLISDAFKNTSRKIWDHVAGVHLLQKAGGIISDMDGRDLDFSQGRILNNNTGAILSNGKFHDFLITK
ncbi:MAG: hypothetical protein JSS76_00490 [Bacteroidetes bacterium]|nr:hypothetical protein [Bacteroidota bacterium]